MSLEACGLVVAGQLVLTEAKSFGIVVVLKVAALPTLVAYKARQVGLQVKLGWTADLIIWKYLAGGDSL